MDEKSVENLLLETKNGGGRRSVEEDVERDGRGGGERGQWDRKVEYVLSLIGCNVGLGNIWRFPYVCIRNGGGAFLIPFLISLMVCGLPVFFLETAMGQFIGKSSWHTWSLCPLFKGIGISMNLLCLFMSWYYSIILAWFAVYLVNSFKSPLNWTQCGQTWNSQACIPTGHGRGPNGTHGNISAIFHNSTFPESDDDYNNNMTGTAFLLRENATYYVDKMDVSSLANGSIDLNDTQLNGDFSHSSANEFWLHNVLEISSGLHYQGGLPWHTTLALLAVNVLIYVAIIKGIRSSGKVVYVTAILPYVLLTIILIAALTRPGSGDGILFYLRPDFSKLVLIDTWVEAFIQAFFSCGPVLGALITMASYNKFHNDCLRDSIILILVGEGSSIYGGLAIFSVLGHLAYVLNTNIENYAKSGAGLVFIVYPDAISFLPLPQLWGVLFFLMLLSVGLDSEFVTIEVLMTTMSDIFPKFMSKWRKSVSAATMVFLTLVGMVFAARGGIYLFRLVEWYYAAFTFLIQAALECIVVGWIYGTKRFCYDIQLMVGRKPPLLFILSWQFIAPAILLVMFVFTLITYKAPVYGGYQYTTVAVAFGWIFAIVPFLTIVLWSIYEIWKRPGSMSERVKSACVPGPEWVPNDPRARTTYRAMVMK